MPVVFYTGIIPNGITEASWEHFEYKMLHNFG